MMGYRQLLDYLRHLGVDETLLRDASHEDLEKLRAKTVKQLMSAPGAR